MNREEIIRIPLKEGETKNYFNNLKQHLGGEIEGSVYRLKQGRANIELCYYSLLPDFEISTVDSTHPSTIIIDREPDERPDFYHINFVQEGGANQHFENKKQNLKAGNSKGGYIYNGLFPMQIEYSPNVNFKMLGFKISKKAFNDIMPEAMDILETLFPNNDPMGYHIMLPVKIQSLVKDIFYFNEKELGKKTMIVSRALEIFTLLIGVVKKLVDKDEMFGLHPSDYERLLKIKAQLLSSFDKKINVEELAEEHGISLSKLKRDFKTLFSTSIYTFYTHAKMDEAYRLLINGNYSVTEVAYDLGYENPSKFSQMFKKVKGINPKDVLSV